jgi:hypothetical protein
MSTSSAVGNVHPRAGASGRDSQGGPDQPSHVASGSSSRCLARHAAPVGCRGSWPRSAPRAPSPTSADEETGRRAGLLNTRAVMTVGALALELRRAPAAPLRGHHDRVVEDLVGASPRPRGLPRAYVRAAALPPGREASHAIELLDEAPVHQAEAADRIARRPWLPLDTAGRARGPGTCRRSYRVSGEVSQSSESVGGRSLSKTFERWMA